MQPAMARCLPQRRCNWPKLWVSSTAAAESSLSSAVREASADTWSYGAVTTVLPQAVRTGSVATNLIAIPLAKTAIVQAIMTRAI